MSEDFVPFKRIADEKDVVTKIEELFAKDTPPAIQLDGARIKGLPPKCCQLPCSIEMLTEHIVFALCQLTSRILGRGYHTFDNIYDYEEFYVDIPAGFTGISFEPVYMRWIYPEEYRCGFLEEESQIASMNIGLSYENWSSCWPSCWNKEISNAVYQLCLPGNAIVAVTNRTLIVPKLRPLIKENDTKGSWDVIIDPSCKIPRVRMTCIHRIHRYFRHLWEEARRAVEQRKESAYLQKVRESLYQDSVTAQPAVTMD